MPSQRRAAFIIQPGAALWAFFFFWFCFVLRHRRATTWKKGKLISLIQFFFKKQFAAVWGNSCLDEKAFICSLMRTSATSLAVCSVGERERHTRSTNIQGQVWEDTFPLQILDAFFFFFCSGWWRCCCINECTWIQKRKKKKWRGKASSGWTKPATQT